MSYRPKIKNNASGALTDLALDAETINGITSADIVTKTLLNSGLTTGGNIIFNDRLVVAASTDLIGDVYVGKWNRSGGTVTPDPTDKASLRVNGTLTTTGEINTNGHSISVGSVNCGEIYGSTAYLGNTSLSSLSVSGTTSLSGNITCNGTFNGSDASYSGSLTVSGTLRANNDLKTQSLYPSTTNSKSLGKSNYLYKHSYITEMHTDKITSLTNTETYIDPTTGEPATRNVFVTMPLASGVITTDESLATVAKTGSYNDLTNKPTIPTVNNATLTIQKNGTTVGTFTANASSNVTANITVPVNLSDISNKNQSYIEWGGPNLNGSVSPLEVATIDDLGHNKFAFLSANSVVVQYSRDSGSTWVDYGATNDQKRALVTLTQSFSIGGRSGSNTVNDKLRIQLNSNNAGGNIYTNLRRILLYVSTNGSGGCTVKVEYRTIGNYRAGTDTWVTTGTYAVGGWSGWNSIPFGGAFGGSNDQTGQVAQIRLTFGVTSVSSTYGNFVLSGIRGIGFPLWQSPSTMASTGHLYSYDISQNATFPANVSATTFTENGTALSSKYLGISSTAADSSKLNGQAASYYLNYNNLSNKPTIPATNVIPATTTANKLLVSTTTSGTSKWSDFSSAGFLKTNASGVISVDTNSYLTTSGTAANSSKLGNVAASNYIQKSNTAGLVKNDGTIDTTAYSTFTGYTSTNKLSTNYINNVAGWTSNVGTVTSVNNVSPVNGNVTLSIPSEVTESTVSGWGFTKNVGTVTSVRVQAGTGLSSSTSTAQTSTLNTTISIASGYKLPTTTEWAGKQNTLSSTNKLSSSYISWDGDIDLSNDPEGRHITNVGGYESSNLDFEIDNDGWLYYKDGNPMSIQETHDSKTIILLTDYSEVRTKNTTYTFKEDGLYLDSTKVTFALGTTATTACAGNDSRLSDSRTPKSHAHGNITNSGTITSTAVTSATGVLVYDSSNKIQRATAANARSIIGAQATLVSGTNIKTINNQSLLGSGNINISGGSSNYTHHSILWYGTISGTYFQGRLNIWDENRTTAWTNSASDKDDLMENLAEWINSCQVIAQGIVRISNIDYPIINYSAGEYEDDDGNVYYTLDFLYMYSGQYRSVRLDTGVNTTYTATTLLDTIID